MTDKHPLSAVLITLNAESQLADTLEILKFCDDVVIVDSGSTDNTLAIAKQFNARVIQQDWMGFGPQKQFAVGQAQFDWVLCLDADEQVSPELRTQIEQTFKQPPPEHVTGFEIARCNAFLGRYLRHGEGYPDWSRRLFHRERAQWSSDPVHEKVEPLRGQRAEFVKLKGDLIHHSAESLHDYLEKQNRYTTIQANALAAKGRCPGTAKMVLSPLIRFVKFYFFRLGFLDGWQGLAHISIGCFNSFIKYAKARALMRKL